MNKLNNLSRLELLIVMTIGYGFFYFLNNYLTKFLYMAPSAHLVHLPSGLKMLMVLVSGMLGAIAITIVGFFWGISNNFSHNIALASCLAIASGVTPLIVIFSISKTLKLSSNLTNLSYQKLLLIALIYAVFNSCVHQLIVYIFSETLDLINGLLIMFTGDVLGISIVLYFCRFGLRVVKRK